MSLTSMASLVAEFFEVYFSLSPPCVEVRLIFRASMDDPLTKDPNCSAVIAPQSCSAFGSRAAKIFSDVDPRQERRLISRRFLEVTPFVRPDLMIRTHFDFFHAGGKPMKYRSCDKRSGRRSRATQFSAMTIW